MKGFTAISALALILGCGSTNSKEGSGTDGPGHLPPDGGGRPDAFVMQPVGPSVFTDFPANPMIDPGVPANAPALFAPQGDPTGGPCLLEPEMGSLFPRNWLRPRF